VTGATTPRVTGNCTKLAMNRAVDGFQQFSTILCVFLSHESIYLAAATVVPKSLLVEVGLI
jgi:hypothetical protein